jgi:predicted O-methyltransferase YrrM
MREQDGSRGGTAVPGFDALWPRADAVGGWLTRDQARALWDAAHQLRPGGTILEIGSHQGRSTIVLASAAADVGATVVAVDPFVSGAMFGGAATRDRFEANLAAAGVRDAVRLIVERSTALRPGWHEPLELLYIDGKHDYWTVRDDLRWTEHLPPGAPVFVHDAFSSIGVTLGLLLHALPGMRLTYVSRTRSLARFEVRPPTVADRMRLLAQLPWWLRNVLIKSVLRVARLLGNRSPDPY